MAKLCKCAILCNIDKLSRNNNLIDMINKAYDILSAENTKYSTDKRIIKDLFKKINNSRDDLQLRLVVIDSLYSTNMNKKIGAIECLTTAIASIDGIRTKFVSFWENADQPEIQNLFNNQYGYKGFKRDRAPSLITKYAYFLTSYQFPVYDSKVSGMLVALSKRELTKMSENPGGVEMHDNFFPVMREIEKAIAEKLKEEKIDTKESIDRFDAFCWLSGKINEEIYNKINAEVANQVEKELKLISAKSDEEIKKIKKERSEKIKKKVIEENKTDNKLLKEVIESLKSKYNLEDKKLDDFAKKLADIGLIFGGKQDSTYEKE